MSPAENTPNFDTMSPEEIIAWMETLAKRQGASEGITTSANVEIPEIDPSSVEIDEPGYVPYGKDPQKWAEEEAARKAMAPPPATTVPKPPAMTPPQPARPAPQVPLAPAQPMRPAAQQVPLPPAPSELPLGQSTLSWLESLAADQGGDLPPLDLSTLTADIAPAAPPAASKPMANPMDWLESLAQGREEDVQPAAPAAQPVPDPFSEGVDPMSWLESVARRQGATSEELTTEANVTVPAADDSVEIEGPGYTPYSFDQVTAASRPLDEPALPEAETAEPESAQLEDPGAWLDALASHQIAAPGAGRDIAAPPEPPMDDDDIQEALGRGEQIPSDEMERWMSRQLELGALRDEPESDYDPDAPAVPAELPDWLIEQVGAAAPPEDVVKPPPQQPALIDLITEPPAASDLPDWLKAETVAEGDLDDIFAMPPAEAAPPAEEPEIDVYDSWAEALEYERQQDLTALPEWYVHNINDPERRAAVDQSAAGGTETTDIEGLLLEEAALPPETGLPLGQPEPLPDWLQGALSEAEEAEVEQGIPDWLQAEIGAPEVEAAPAEVVVEPAAEIPDWLQAVDVDEVPDWLRETISPPAPAPVVPQQPVVSPPIVATPPPMTIEAPAAPAAQPAAQLDAEAALYDARASINNQDIEGGLRHYESLIRMNAQLGAVSADLTGLADRIKTDPAIYRVLGDSLMREGKLQSALDTYRKALNQL